MAAAAGSSAGVAGAGVGGGAPSMLAVKGVLALDAQGKRICAKYYTDDWATQKAQADFEGELFRKTHRANSEILMWENAITVYRSSGDVLFYVIGSPDENELVLMSVLNAFTDTISRLLQGQVDSHMVLENLDYVLLALDEIVDGGIILESDAAVVANRVSMQGLGDEEQPLAEQKASDVLKVVKTQLVRSLLQ